MKALLLLPLLTTLALAADPVSVTVHAIDEKIWVELQEARAKVAELEEKAKRAAGWKPPSDYSSNLTYTCGDIASFTAEFHGGFVIVKKVIETVDCGTTISDTIDNIDAPVGGWITFDMIDGSIGWEHEPIEKENEK